MRIAVCDDDSVLRDNLHKSILAFDSLPSETSIAKFSDGHSLVDAHSKQPYNIIFLDIQMGGLSGLEAGALIRDIDQKVLIILVTSYEQFMQKAFKIETFDYITKPYEDKDIHAVLKRALRKHIDQYRSICLTWRGATHKVKHSDIIYIKIDNRHLNFITTDEDAEIKCIGKLDEYERELAPHGFFRCHKSYLVNMDFISSVANDKIVVKHSALENDHVINISSRKRKEFLGAFNEYVAKYRV